MTPTARGIVMAALLSVATVASAQEAEPLRLRGRLAEEFAYRLHDPGDVSKLRTTGWLDAKYAFSEGVSLRVGTRAWYDAVFDAIDRYPAHVERDQKTELDLREAVLQAPRVMSTCASVVNRSCGARRSARS